MPDLFRTFQAEELDEKGKFTGYASVFDVVDSYGTVFDRGAFRKTVKDHNGRFPIVWMHEVKEPIGSAIVDEDEKGLRVREGQLDLDVQRGREVYSGMMKSYITDMSHRFFPIRSRPVDRITHFQEVRLREISPATMNFASTGGAAIESVRVEDDVRGVIPSDLPLADSDMAWDAGEANQRVQAWAKGESDEVDMAKYRRAFLWVDGDGENLTDYKFPIGDVVSGTLKAMPRAIYAAAGRINQAQGVDRDAVKAQLAQYYRKMGETAPWLRTQIVVPHGLVSEVERLRARLSTPVGAAAPRIRTPGNHLRTLSDEIQRLERALKGTP